MKKKEKQTLSSMKVDELRTFISDSKDTLYAMVVQKFSKPIKNVREQKIIRKKIAVAKTLLQIKELTHEK